MIGLQMGFEGVASEVGSAITTIASDATSVLTTVAPIAIGVAGAFLVWRLGMRFFKSIAK